MPRAVCPRKTACCLGPFLTSLRAFYQNSPAGSNKAAAKIREDFTLSGARYRYTSSYSRFSVFSFFYSDIRNLPLSFLHENTFFDATFSAPRPREFAGLSAHQLQKMAFPAVAGKGPGLFCHAALSDEELSAGAEPSCAAEEPSCGAEEPAPASLEEAWEEEPGAALDEGAGPLPLLPAARLTATSMARWICGSSFTV